MKLNTRLIIIFFAIVVLPFILAGLTYLTICGSIAWNLKQAYGIKNVPISAALSPTELYSTVTEEYMVVLREKLEQDTDYIKNTEELTTLDEELSRISSFLVVKKGDEIYYLGTEHAEDPVLNVLSIEATYPEGSGASLYYNDIKRVVKQTNFTTSDGQKGTIYFVTMVGMMVSEVTGPGVIISIIVVLALTGILLTSWLSQGIIKPMLSLKSAMTRIEEGDLDTPATTLEKGEIGELFEGYEQMRKRLKESDDEKVKTEAANRELVSNISHDLKTPITSIKGYVEGIQDGIADSPEKMEKYIKTIYNKSCDMDFLIDELTMYSKIDADQIPYQFHRMNVCDYFTDCAEEVGLDLENKGIDFIYQPSCSQETEMYADPEQLKRVINNIINNSVKYRRDTDSRIVLRVSEPSGVDIKVEIEDNGKGISEKDAVKIFDRMYRTDASRNSKQGGSGIGLSIAKKVVENHQGRIWATGEEGKGMTIHFTLPIYKEAVPEAVTPEEETNNPIVKIEKMVGKTVESAVAGVKTGVAGVKTGVEKTMAEIEKKTKRETGDDE
jgi:signal transduction histidine kinase